MRIVYFYTTEMRRNSNVIVRIDNERLERYGGIESELVSATSYVLKLGPWERGPAECVLG